MTMQNEESLKKVCKKCNGMGHALQYEAPRVIRKYCDCETGKKMKKFIKELAEAIDNEPVWELLSL
tara:strand:- start:49 stop:246 length:198 start_codon:yes stop_codon:yes gene_type:complete